MRTKMLVMINVVKIKILYRIERGVKCHKLEDHNMGIVRSYLKHKIFTHIHMDKK